MSSLAAVMLNAPDFEYVLEHLQCSAPDAADQRAVTHDLATGAQRLRMGVSERG